MSFRPRRDVGAMRGARSSILESMKWAVQVRRAAITMRHHAHLHSGVFENPRAVASQPGPEGPWPTGARAHGGAVEGALALRTRACVLEQTPLFVLWQIPPPHLHSEKNTTHTPDLACAPGLLLWRHMMPSPHPRQ